MKLWQKNYSLNKQIEEFTVGEDYLLDQRLVKYDCVASIAHAKMLGKIGILTSDEVRELTGELNRILELDEKGEFRILKEQEDCHTAIENHLTERLGDLGKRIHTGRSRNDQVLTALWLFYKDQLLSCKDLAGKFCTAIAGFVKKNGAIELPGYTHTRKAMPSSVGLWANSFRDAMVDNLKIVDVAIELIDQSPLGTAAGYGAPLEIDREFTAGLLGFGTVQENPIYAQASRGKFESTIAHGMTQIMADLNRMATDLIVFSMPEFGYFDLPEEFCTGSSIMPQKKNPDVLELLRARYHLVVSYEVQIKSLSGNLLSGYNRDLQLTKEPTMKGLDVTKSCLSISSLIFEALKVDEARCAAGLSEETYATAEVYGLVKQGVPFREAYQLVSEKLDG